VRPTKLCRSSTMTSFVLDSVKELIRPGSDSPLFWRLKPSKTPESAAFRAVRPPCPFSGILVRNQPVADYRYERESDQVIVKHKLPAGELDLSSRWMSLAGASASHIVDDVTRECLAAIPDTSISGRRMARELPMLIETRGKPQMIVSDHGTEFTSNAILAGLQIIRSNGTTSRQANRCRTASSRALTGGCATSSPTRACSSTSSIPASSSVPGSPTTTRQGALRAWLPNAGGLCRTNHRANRRKTGRGSNRRWMKLQWQVKSHQREAPFCVPLVHPAAVLVSNGSTSTRRRCPPQVGSCTHMVRVEGLTRAVSYLHPFSTKSKRLLKRSSK